MSASRLIRFGEFEVDLAAGELRKNGTKIRLQDQPFRMLKVLLARPGEVVTREELRAELWPDDTYVDFDRSLNTAANKLREALGDSASRPTLIETLPRRGYRFVGQVESPSESPTPVHAAGVPAVGIGAAASLTRAEPSAPREAEAALLRHPAVQRNILGGALLAVLAVGAAFWPDSAATDRSRVLRFSPAIPSDVRKPDISPDGRHIAWLQGEPPAGKVWVLDLDKQEPREIAATEGAWEHLLVS